MINKICNIEIEGGFFSEKSTFALYPNETDRVSIIYGKNGSGKSSIAKAINDYKQNIGETFSSVELSDKDNNCILLDESVKESIFVFNEEFIEKNIKLAQDGLNTVIMFGEQGDLEEKIKAVKDAMYNKNQDLSLAKQNLMEYNETTNSKSPDYFLNIIDNILKQDGNWATRESIIKGNKNKASVSVDIRNSVMNRHPVLKLENLNNSFEDYKNRIIKSSASSERIDVTLDNVKFSNDFEENIIKLLAKQIEKPQVSEREKKILSIIELGEQNLIEHSKKHFAEEKNNFCPYCFQSVDDKYKNQLLKEINNVLNKDVEIHKSELDELLLVRCRDINDSLKLVEIVDGELVNKIKLNLNTIEGILLKYQRNIELKKENIYKPIIINSLNLMVEVDKVNENIDLLRKSIESYNDVINNRKKIIDEAKEINLDIAWFEVKSQVDLYTSQVNEKNNVADNVRNLEKDISGLQIVLNQLMQSKKNAGIALDIINKDLEYIFFSDKRLKLEYNQDKYKILSYGKPVKLNKVSAGERNIIALSYFFTLILDNVQKGDEYKKDIFLVIDDPISSFDFENKIGIYSFLKSKIDSIMLRNSNSKIVVMTHELEAIYSLNKLCGEYKKEEFTTAYLMLESKKMDNFPMKTKRNEYNVMLERVYNYGNSSIPEDDLTIGNIMRKVLETFSTFEFRLDIDKVMRDDAILKQLGEKSSYYKNLMYRLVLNNESHMEEKTLFLPETDFYAYTSPEEKARTCRDILTFIYLINPVHIEMHFRNNQTIIADIKSWVENIK